MAWVPQYFQASTQEIAEEALQKGILKYPGICFIQDGSYFSWVTVDGTLVKVGGYDQITDIQYTDGILYFMAGSKILYAVNLPLELTPEVIEEIKNEILGSLDLNDYIKVEDVVKLIDTKIGDLGDSTNIIEYLKTLSYNTLLDTPIENITGSLTQTIIISDLTDGIYKINGQFKIGGTNQTVQMPSDEILFFVQRNSSDDSINITQLLGNSIKLHIINNSGECSTTQYITENWINAQDYISSREVKEYVQELVKDSIIETINSVLDEHIEMKFEPVPDDDITTLFK